METRIIETADLTEDMEVFERYSFTRQGAEVIGQREAVRQTKLGFPCRYAGVTKLTPTIDRVNMRLDELGIPREEMVGVTSVMFAAVLIPE